VTSCPLYGATRAPAPVNNRSSSKAVTRKRERDEGAARAPQRRRPAHQNLKARGVLGNPRCAASSQGRTHRRSRAHQV
jgi:hypothetical protein